jgi:DNA end-binding protein Ku
MAMRSIWKGSITFLLVSIPVKLYNATDTSDKIKFNWLHAGSCLGRVGMEKKCKKCEAKLEQPDIVNGFEYEVDQYAIIGEEEVKAVKIKSTKAIEIVGFVNPDEVPRAAYSDSYYAGADGFPAEKAYALLHDAMTQTGKIAIGRLVLRDREEVVTLEPVGKGLLIKRLHYSSEVRNIAEVPGIIGTATLDENEQALASQLVSQMEISFSEVDCTDNYTAKLREVIDAKIKGKQVAVSADSPASPKLDVMAALTASLAAMKKTKPATESKPALTLVKEKTTKRKKAA